MLIVGTGGLARDVITSWELDPKNQNSTLYLYDNVNIDKHLLYEKYPILHTIEDLKKLFDSGESDFFVCIGNPLLRKRVTETIEKIGGNLVPFISCSVSIVSPETKLIAGGVVIEPAVGVSKDVIL